MNMEQLESLNPMTQELHLIQFVANCSLAKAESIRKAFGGASYFISASESALRAKAMPRATQRRLRAFQEASAAYHWRKVVNRPALSSWNSLLDYLSVAMASRDTEEFRVLFLDRKNVLIANEVMNHGTVDHAPVYPREIVKRALELCASALILVHNHPSGDPTPSRADIAMTNEIVEATRALRIVIHDHIVVGIGCNPYMSFKALGLL